MKNIAYIYHYWSRKKALNLLKSLTSFYVSKITRRYFVWGKPFSYFVEPTNRCNLHCFECPVGLGILDRPQGNMNSEQFRTVLDNISASAWHLLLYFQGEPTLNPDLIQMIEYAHQEKIFTELSTNGVLLQKAALARKIAGSHLGKIVISMDGISEESYRVYRKNGSLSAVKQGIRFLAAYRREMRKQFPRIVIQFLVMRHNEHEIDKVKQLGKKLGADRVVFKSAQIYNFDQAEEVLPRQQKFRRYKKHNGTYKLKGSFSGYCRKLWIGAVITQDLQVLPCCFDKDAIYSQGHLEESSFEHIWRSESYHNFRKKVIQDRESIAICRNCSEGMKTFFNS